MSKVHLLPPDIISKIAAGEVIDRPASVIKELLENAIDAQASEIVIDITGAGKTLIRVRDNGTGIDREDMEKIFQRHATSKISAADDLFDIHSLGFRGEALYSICAVSDVTLRSRARGQDSGWEIHTRGGSRLSLRPSSVPAGTDIEVKELFFNTPARRKFLKSDTSETHQILSTVIPYTLLYPRCRFLLTRDNTPLLDLPPAATEAERAASALNLNKNFFIEFQEHRPDRTLSVHMIMGDINIIRARRDMQFIFINGRPVENKNISFHLNDVYRLILPPRHYPFFTLSIALPAADLDVNIHPSKREVKIREEQTLCSTLRHLCEAALMNAGRPKLMRDPDSSSAADTHPSSRRMIGQALADTDGHSSGAEKPYDDASPQAGASYLQSPTEQYAFPMKRPEQEASLLLFPREQGSSLKERLAAARFSGSFSSRYLFFESEKTLLIVDQHAAQERIMFELFIEQMRSSRVEVQQLLSPCLVKIAPQDRPRWEETQKKLADIGFDTTLFDEQTVAIHSHPVLIKDPQHAVMELLAHGDTPRCGHDQIARRACRASVMSGDPMTKEQADFQRRQLLDCRDPFTCPHGRPTVITITADYLDKQFLRT